MKALTAKQQAVLRLIVKHWREHAKGPTVRSLMEPMGVKSSCTIQRHLDALARKGYIERDRYGYRSVRPAGHRAPEPAEMLQLLQQAAAALAPFAREAEVIGTWWQPGEPLPDAGPDPTFLDYRRAAETLAAIRAATAQEPSR